MQRRWWAGGFFGPEQIEHALARAQAGPRWLRHAHVATAAIWMVLACGPTSVVEFGGAALGVATIARLPWVWRAVLVGFAHPVMLAIAAWCGFRALSLAWSTDAGQGLDQIGAMRFAWSVPLLVPVAPAAGRLALAVAAGFALGNLSQVSHGLSRAGIGWLPEWNRLPSRNSGWWDPVVGGTLLCAALGLHAGAALRARGRLRSVALAGVVASLAAIVATGTRGAWLAAAAVVVLAAGAKVVLSLRGGAAPRRGLFVGAVAGVLVVAGLAPVAAPRAQEAYSELAAIVRDGDYSSFTGARLLMMWWSLEAFAEHPLAGTGEGGYRAWCEANLRARGVDPAERHVGAHPHTTYLQPLGATGIVGAALFVVVLVAVGVAGWRARGSADPYASGTAWALLGLFVAGVFDPVHVNAQTAAMWMVLTGLAVGTSLQQVAERQRLVRGDVNG
ncbi:MAG: O-antigen ligase family protein [Planctomycetota bacterium]